MVVASHNNDTEDDTLCNDCMRSSHSDDIDGKDVGKSWMKYERMAL